MDNRKAGKADRRANALYPGEDTAMESDDSMDHWLREMEQSDIAMCRVQEDLLTHLIKDHGYGEIIHPTLMAKWANKRTLRSSR